MFASEDQTHSAGVQVEHTHREHEQDRADHAREEIVAGDVDHHRPHERMPRDVAQPLAELGAHRLSRRRRGVGKRLLAADRRHEERRHDEADRVGEDRVRRSQRCDEHARKARAGNLSRGAAGLELRVPVRELVPLDERRQIGLVGDVEADGQAPVTKPTA